MYEYKGYQPPPKGWAISREKMEEWDREGRLHFPANPNGRIRRKRFADELQGKPVQNLWDDIQMIASQSSERVGYPTQKPLALLERSHQGQQQRGRHRPRSHFAAAPLPASQPTSWAASWVGIDISPKAVELVNMRLQQTMGSLFHHGYVTARNGHPPPHGHRGTHSLPPEQARPIRPTGRNMQRLPDGVPVPNLRGPITSSPNHGAALTT